MSKTLRWHRHSDGRKPDIGEAAAALAAIQHAQRALLTAGVAVRWRGISRRRIDNARLGSSAAEISEAVIREVDPNTQQVSMRLQGPWELRDEQGSSAFADSFRAKGRHGRVDFF